MPLIIPICLLTSHCIFGAQSFRSLRFLWIIFNMLGTIVFGFMHQGGVVPSLNYVQKIFTHPSNVDINQHVIYYQTYMPPRFLVMAPVSMNLVGNKRFIYERKLNSDERIDSPLRYIHELTYSSNYSQLENLIQEIKSKYNHRDKIKSNKNYALFLVTPSINDYELASKNSNKVQNQASYAFYQLQAKFKFHFSFEHLFKQLKYLKSDFHLVCLKNGLDNKITKCLLNNFNSLMIKILDLFSLNLYQIAV